MTLLKGDRPAVAFCVVLIAAGVALRIQHLEVPHFFNFDERHFVVKGARSFLQGKADWNDHPPLGKLFIAASMLAFGDTSWAWRVPSLVAGIAMIGMGGLLARLLFQDRLAGVIAAAFIAADGLFLSYSRSAVMDGVLTALLLASAFFLVRARSAWDVALASVLAGMCTCVKFTGVVLLVPLVLTCVVNRKRLPWWTLLTVGLLVPLAYWSCFAVGLLVGHHPVTVVAETKRLVEGHLKLNDWTNRWTSHWTTWFVPIRPIVMCWLKLGPKRVRVMTSLPNLAILWASTAVAFVSFLRLATLGPRGFLTRLFVGGPGFFHRDLAAVGWLTLLWVLPIVPWTISDRDTYFYHYLPSYIFAVILFGGAVTRLVRARPLWGWSVLVVVAAVFVVYAPAWSQIPMRIKTFHRIMFLDSWGL
jgi:dolichyl-phosphate-mannose--protein O-mannosyl transferase